MTTFAVLADIHGNRWALEAVLEDLARTPGAAIINLGDTLWGALDPAGTADTLMRLPARHVRGNTDREMLEHTGARSTTDAHSLAALTGPRRAWLAAHEPPFVVGEVLACHGTPAHDDVSLIEEIAAGSVRRRNGFETGAVLGPVPAPVTLVLCGHTHVPGIVQVPGGPLVVNPGSVGLPAYSHDVPCPHRMESGAPHARYALVRRDRRGWDVDLRAVAYDWEAAARCAAEVGRRDWAHQLRTGHVA
ncbi:MAG TPA: metallophosphoesterase family protein [Vicinamibacterales bacterium]|nr:metallophosphoesterase family protein [Vicinamibacterales bacterium]